MPAFRLSLTALTAALALVACGAPQAPSPDAAVPPVAAEDVEADQPAVQELAVPGPGSLDPTYRTNFGGFGTLNNMATHVKALPSGKTLVMFQLRAANHLDQHLVVRRYNTDGTLDRTFGQSGAVGIKDVSGGSRTLVPAAISVAPDGRIFIAATGSNPTWTTQKIVRPVIFALTPEGVFDSGFDGNGQFYPASASYPLSNTSGSVVNQTYAGDLAYDRVSRKLTLGGTIDPSSGRSFFWTLTFNIDQTSVRRENFVKESGADLRLEQVERLPSGETVMAGDIQATGGGLPSAYVARQLDNGLVLAKRPLGIGSGAFVQTLRLDGGKALLAGTTFPNGVSGTRGFVARLTLDSLFLDPTFGTNGLRLVGKEVRDLAVARGGKLVVVGGEGKRIMAARLTPEGQMDGSFGTGGVSLPLTNIAGDSNEFAIAVDLDAQNRVLLGGIVKRPGLHDRNRVARLLP